MRLQKSEVDAIKEAIYAFDPRAKIYLFDSRVDDTKKGGDIDLLIESNAIGLADVKISTLIAKASYGFENLMRGVKISICQC